MFVYPLHAIVLTIGKNIKIWSLNFGKFKTFCLTLLGNDVKLLIGTDKEIDKKVHKGMYFIV